MFNPVNVIFRFFCLIKTHHFNVLTCYLLPKLTKSCASCVSWLLGHKIKCWKTWQPVKNAWVSMVYMPTCLSLLKGINGLSWICTAWLPKSIHDVAKAAGNSMFFVCLSKTKLIVTRELPEPHFRNRTLGRQRMVTWVTYTLCPCDPKQKVGLSQSPY